MTPEEQAAADTAAAAAAKAASDTAASDKAAADKAAADKTAADAAAAAAGAGKTPEQLAAEKTAAETETARKAAEQAKAPEKYDLKLPEHTVFDASDLELFGAQAKALGLTNDAAQNFVNAHIDTVSALSQKYEADAKADPEIGGAKFDETVRLATVGRDWLFPPEGKGSALLRGLFNKTGLGNHPEVLRAFARVGKAKQEDTAVAGGGSTGKSQKSTAEMFYTSMPAT